MTAVSLWLPLCRHACRLCPPPSPPLLLFVARQAAAKALQDLGGVVDHGLFLDMVSVCIIAGKEGIEVKERRK